MSLNDLRISLEYINHSLVIIITLLAKTPRSEMHPAGYVFGSAGLINQTGLDGNPGWNNGLAFLFGLLSVQWTVRYSSLRDPWKMDLILISLADDGEIRIHWSL